MAKGPPELGLVAVLAMIQLAPATTTAYVGMNMVIELCLLLRVLSRTTFGEGESVVSRFILILSVALLVIGSLPWFGLIPGRFDASIPYTSSSGVSLASLLASTTSICVVLALLIGVVQARRAPVNWRKRLTARTGEGPERRVDLDTQVAEFYEEKSIRGLTSDR